MFTLASKETYQDGEIIFEEGNKGDSIYFILSGSVEISKMAGEKKAILDLLQQGEVFGELAFLGGTQRTATAKAVGETTVGLIERDSLDQDLEKLSPGFKAILDAVVKRFKKMIDMRSPLSYRDLRVPKTLAVTYKDNQSIVKAYAGDISTGGLFIRTEQPLEPGEKLSLKLHLPGLLQPVEMNCQVAWVRKEAEGAHVGPAGMGVKFLEMTERDNEVLRQYIKAIEKMDVRPEEMSEKDSRILREYIDSLSSVENTP